MNSQAKGKRFERDFCKMLNRYFGTNVRRTPNSGGLSIKGDVLDLTGPLAEWHFECKNQERLNFYKAIEQAKRDCPGRKKWLVAFTRNNEDTYVILDVNDWMALVEKAARVDELEREIWEGDTPAQDEN